MSTLSQMFWYLNQEKHPTALELETYWTSISVTDKLKKTRRKYRRELKREEDMSLEYINKTYSVQAEQGGRIKYTYPKPAKFGTIKGSMSDGQYIEVLFDGEKRTVRLHPTWEIEYLQEKP